jgi:hypothetical protein
VSLKVYIQHSQSHVFHIIVLETLFRDIHVLKALIQVQPLMIETTENVYAYNVPVYDFYLMICCLRFIQKDVLRTTGSELVDLFINVDTFLARVCVCQSYGMTVSICSHFFISISRKIMA